MVLLILGISLLILILRVGVLLLWRGVRAGSALLCAVGGGLLRVRMLVLGLLRGGRALVVVPLRGERV